MNVGQLRSRLRQPLQLLVGHRRRLLPGAVVLRHRPVAGAALPVGALGRPRAASACSSTASFKMPMQFLILFVGVMVFVFYLFVAPPLFFNAPRSSAWQQTAHAPELARARRSATTRPSNDAARRGRRATWRRGATGGARAAARRARAAAAARRDPAREAKALITTRAARAPRPRTPTTSSSSLRPGYLPRGLVGLLIAVIFCAAMSSTASELTALGSTTTLDLYQRAAQPAGRRDPRSDLRASEALHRALGRSSPSASPPSRRCSTT